MTDPPDSIDDHPDLAALPDPIAVAHEMAAAVLDNALDGGYVLSVELRRRDRERQRERYAAKNGRRTRPRRGKPGPGQSSLGV